MKKKEIKQYEITLDPTEAKLVKICLDYCWHRLTKHDECGIYPIVDEGLLQYLRENLIK
jgi:hypothetical protein